MDLETEESIEVSVRFQVSDVYPWPSLDDLPFHLDGETIVPLSTLGRAFFCYFKNGYSSTLWVASLFGRTVIAQTLQAWL